MSDVAEIEVSAAPSRNPLPTLGIRNYWYPALAGWRLGRKPRAVRLLGEDIVLFRSARGLHALADRCPHRGAKLSRGTCLYPEAGTVSCPYHGWTFDGESGRCVAKLMEGPEARIPAAAQVKPYPVREFGGTIWVFVGDMAAVPLEEDLPESIADRAHWHSITNWRTYACNWRLLMDNLAHDQHAPFLHRNSPELVFQPVFPHASRNAAVPLEDGKGIGHLAQGGVSAAEYPGLGRFPPKTEEWRRILPAVGRGKEIDPERSPAVVKYGIRFRHMNRLPSVALIGRPHGDFFTCRWIVPVDEGRTILFNFNLYRRGGALKTAWDRVVWLVWKSWAHDWLFSDQDKHVVEGIVEGDELLSRTDVGVAAWRRFVMRHARRPEAAPVREAG